VSASIVFIYVGAILAKGFLAEALEAESLLYKLIAAIIALFFGSCAVWIVVINLMNFAAVRKVITHDENLTIRNLWYSKSIRWEDINEFGTYTAGFGHHRIRRYYLKGRDSPNEIIDLCTQHLENLKELIDTIFLMATNAEFVIAENVARIPFTKQIQLLPWDRRDQSLY